VARPWTDEEILWAVGAKDVIFQARHRIRSLRGQLAQQRRIVRREIDRIVRMTGRTEMSVRRMTYRADGPDTPDLHAEWVMPHGDPLPSSR
jgi:hypothetical protein